MHYLELLTIFLRLGLTSFGGPTAHLSYFREEFVARRQWLSEAEYAEIVALCQFLPGPASSQVGMTIGIVRGGIIGGLIAWFGFTMPSALALIGVAYGVAAFGDISGAGWLRGLLIVAVAVVANAIWGMAKKLCPDRLRAAIALAAALAMLLVPGALSQLALIGLAGIIGWRFVPAEPRSGTAMNFALPNWLSPICWVAFVGLLIGLPLAAQGGDPLLGLLAALYRAGALVFGGGHVVLPLLEAGVVPPGWLSQAEFLAGYAAAQAVPGPLFTLGAYIGAATSVAGGGLLIGLLALLAIFLPAFLLLFGTLPIWARLRQFAPLQAALGGINAAVVGILLAAFYDPIFVSAVTGPREAALAIGAWGILVVGRAPAWAVVLIVALLGGLFL